ncbi:MAG: RNA polymerase sigma factor [Nitrospira sp.]
MDRNEILTHLRARILSFATSRLSRDAAEDLTQEVLVLLHEKYANVTELTELVPLAFQVLRFKMLDAHRKSLRRGEYNQDPIDEHQLVHPSDDPARQLDQKQRVDRLLTAVAQLGERCRDLFRLKLEGNSFPEIQKITGQKSINTIYTWDLRCRKQLLDLMGGSWN